MSDSIKPLKASFSCKYCLKNIQVPSGLPATTAPCPYCGKEVTSPDFSNAEAIDSKPAEAGDVVGLKAQQSVQAALIKKPILTSGPALAIKKTTDLPRINEELDEKASGSSNEARFVWVVLIVLMSVIVGLAAWLVIQEERPVVEERPAVEPEIQVEIESGPTAEESRQEWIAQGWKKAASEVLAGFMAAQSVEERMQYVIPNDGVEADLREFYPPGTDDQDTPMEFFVHRSGSKQDRERGIFRMQYHQPGQVELSDYFAPIGTLDKITQLRGATLIDMAYAIDKSNVSAPIAIAAFFKGAGQGLKLDASIFMQGKFRTFHSFVNYPKQGRKKIFRVAISESIDHELRDDKRYRSYQIEDFAYPEEHVNVSVKVDSKVGRALADINWRGMNREYQSRSATIELAWSKDKPARLQIERFICWEFLGVGGTIDTVDDPSKHSEGLINAATTNDK